MVVSNQTDDRRNLSWTIEKTLNILVPTCIKKRPPSKPIKQSIEGEGFLSGTKK